MKNEYIVGGVGTAFGVVGTATQINETLQTISLIITIIGALISFVVVPFINWRKEAKKDGKITTEEMKEGAEVVKDGLKKTHDVIKGGQTDNGDKREETKKKEGENNG